MGHNLLTPTSTTFLPNQTGPTNKASPPLLCSAFRSSQLRSLTFCPTRLADSWPWTVQSCLGRLPQSKRVPGTRLPQRPPWALCGRQPLVKHLSNIFASYPREQISGKFHQGGTRATSLPSNEPHTLSTRPGSQPQVGLLLACSITAPGVVAAPCVISIFFRALFTY